MSDGFTMIPNDLLDLAMRRDKLQPAERCVLLYLIRQTLGYNRADSSTFGSIGAITSATGYGRVTVINAIKGLLASGLVTRAHQGGPGKGASVYAIASTVDRTSTVGCSTASYTTPSTVGYTTPSTVGCTLKETKNKQGTNNPPNPPRGSGWMDDLRSIEDEESFGDFDPDAWTPARLVVHLGGRVPIPPLQQPRWAAIILNSTEEQIAEALKLAETADRPARYFLALFDDQGKRKADPEWKGKRKPAASRTPEEKKAYFAEITRKAEEQLATMAPLTRR